MLEIDAYHINNTKFIKSYNKTCHESEQIISITFTLNPKMNNADILTQYRSMIKEIKGSNLFYYKTHHKDTAFSIHPGFIKLMICPELTRTLNSHIHGILIIDPKYNDYFKNEIRRLCWNNEVLGRQFAFNVVNDLLKDREAVAKYPFKDTNELLKFTDSGKMYYYSFEFIEN